MSFTAQYHGRCGNCDGDVKGKEVVFAADALVHVTCPADPTVQQRPACPTCFMELSVSGVCGECND